MITPEQIKNEVALRIRKDGLNNFLDIDEVMKEVLEKMNSSQSINEIGGSEDIATPDTNITPEPGEKTIPVVSPEQQSAYIPEMPDMLKNIEPGKIIVFDYNELSEGGEKLTNKPFRTFEDPDARKSMRDMWVSEGKKSADVFIAKFEKIGTLDFDYANGATTFNEMRFEPDFQAQNDYKSNPYATGPTPEAVKTSVDIEKALQDTIKDLLKKALGVQPEQSTSEPVYNQPTVDIGSENIGTATPQTPTVVNNQLTQPEQRITDAIDNPMKVGFVYEMRDLVAIDTKFKKVDIPKEIAEAIEGKNKNVKIIQETNEITGWHLDGKNYYLPKNTLSKRKVYTIL